MRHRKSGRKLNRNQSHRTSMFRNMATSLIVGSRPDTTAPNSPKVAGRIITTVEKAKELRPIVEKLITMGKKAAKHQDAAAQYATAASRGSAERNDWRKSDRWRQWA